MLKKDELVKRIAKRKNMDERVVRLIADYPFKFTRDRMSDPADWRAIRIRHFGVFALRLKFTMHGLLPTNNVLK